MRATSSPPPELKCKPFLSLGNLGDMTRPRLFFYEDGDGTNAVLSLGVSVSAESCDPLLSAGLDMVVPPRLFRLLNPLLKRVGR